MYQMRGFPVQFTALVGREFLSYRESNYIHIV